MRILSCVLIVCLLQLGCSSSYVVSSSPDADPSFASFNADAVGEDLKMSFEDGRNVSATEVIAGPDSTSLLDESTGARTVVPACTLRHIVRRDGGVGFLEGFGFGAPGGSVTVLAASGSSSSSSGISGGGATFAFALIGGALVGLLCGIPGAIIGHSYEYQFTSGTGGVAVVSSEILEVTMDKIMEETATSFTGRMGFREYQFEKTEATYSSKQTPTGVTISVRGSRTMFLQKGVLDKR